MKKCSGCVFSDVVPEQKNRRRHRQPEEEDVRAKRTDINEEINIPNHLQKLMRHGKQQLCLRTLREHVEEIFWYFTITSRMTHSHE